MLEELCDSAVEVGRELAKLAGSEKRWRSIIKNMLCAWDRGMQETVLLLGLGTRENQGRDRRPQRAAGAK